MQLAASSWCARAFIVVVREKRGGRGEGTKTEQIEDMCQLSNVTILNYYRFLEEPHYPRTPDSQIQLEMREMDTSVTVTLVDCRSLKSIAHASGAQFFLFSCTAAVPFDTPEHFREKLNPRFCGV